MENKTIADVLIDKGVVASMAELRFLLFSQLIRIDDKILLSGDIPVNYPKQGLGKIVYKGKLKYII